VLPVEGYFVLQAFPSTGISGIFTDMDDVRAHGKDERLGVKEYYEGNEFMYNLSKCSLRDQRNFELTFYAVKKRTKHVNDFTINNRMKG